MGAKKKLKIYFFFNNLKIFSSPNLWASYFKRKKKVLYIYIYKEFLTFNKANLISVDTQTSS